jgi:hypothetical protein
MKKTIRQKKTVIDYEINKERRVLASKFGANVNQV